MSQRPSWIRLSSLAMRQPVPPPIRPPPTAATIRPPSRPTIPIRPPPPPAQTQNLAPSPPSPPQRTPPLPIPRPDTSLTTPRPGPSITTLRPSEITTPAPPSPAPTTATMLSPTTTSSGPSPVSTPAVRPHTPPVNSPPPNTNAPPRSPTSPPPPAATAPPAQQPSPAKAPPPSNKSPTPIHSPLTSKPMSPPITPTQSQQLSSPLTTRTLTPPPSSLVPKPLLSPKITKLNPENSLTQSPNLKKPICHPPSPLTLPPPQMKSDVESESAKHKPRIERKSVLVQETIDKPMKIIHNNPHPSGTPSKGKREPGNGTKDYKGSSKKLSDSEDLGMRIITLAGENRGAIMELSPSLKKSNNLAKYASSSESQESGAENGGEGKSKKKENNRKDTALPTQPMTGFFNSNIQGINNSILYNAKCRHNDPGVHISLVRKPNENCKNHG